MCNCMLSLSLSLCLRLPFSYRLSGSTLALLFFALRLLFILANFFPVLVVVHIPALVRQNPQSTSSHCASVFLSFFLAFLFLVLARAFFFFVLVASFGKCERPLMARCFCLSCSFVRNRVRCFCVLFWLRTPALSTNQRARLYCFPLLACKHFSFLLLLLASPSFFSFLQPHPCHSPSLASLPFCASQHEERKANERQ